MASEGTTRELVSEDGNGAPGFAFTCRVLGINTTDTCIGRTSALAEVAVGGVDEVFDSHSEKLTCSVKGAASGSIEGTRLLESPLSGALTIKAS